MPVGVAALASAIARPRRATRRIASASRSTPAAAAAVISPTEWPARAPTPAGTAAVGARPAAEGAQGEQPGADEQRLGDGGVLDGVLVGRVPWATRSTPAASESSVSCSRRPGSSSHGLRKPGVWEPWPGQTMTITGPA